MGNLQTRQLAANEALFRAGDAGQDVYVVESGRIETYQHLPSGELRHLMIAGPGDLCGERALLGEPHRNATAIATEPTTVSLLNDDALGERIAKADPFVRHLLVAAIERCEELQHTAVAPTADAVMPEAAPAVPGNAAADPYAELRLALSQALVNQELTLHFQPVIRVGDRSVAGFEALLRWIRPTAGRLLPHEFLWLAEETGLIVPIGEWMTGVACASASRLNEIQQAEQPDAAPLFVAINLSPQQCHPRQLQVLERALAAHHLRPRQLRLEISEAALVDQLDNLQEFLSGCKALGVRLTVDNVGGGPSVLPYLRHLPIDTLTLTDALVHDMAQHATSRTVVAAICRLAADLDLDTLAKGVETAQQHESAYSAGFRYAQGFHYGAPMPLEDCARFLQTRARQAAQPSISR